MDTAVMTVFTDPLWMTFLLKWQLEVCVLGKGLS